MKKSSLWLISLTCLLACHIAAQTMVEEGVVSGVWSKTGSPYIVNGTVNIPAGSVLTIEPGVEVNFSGHHKFIVEGKLLAQGNPGDSIIFTASDANTGWHGLRFLNTIAAGEDTSKISWCRIEHGRVMGDCPDNRGGAVYSEGSNILISHCTLRRNKAVSGAADWGGGAIYCDRSNLIITENLITENYSGHDGGAIYCAFSRPVIKRNTIINNEAAMRGGGIASFTFSSPEVLNNTIKNNTAIERGGGIYISGGTPLILHNYIENNHAGLGGGINCYLSEAHIINNQIINNSAGSGGATYICGCSPVITSNTVCNNEASLYGGGITCTFEIVGVPVYSNPVLTANIIYGNESEEGSQLWSADECLPVLVNCNVQDMNGTGIIGNINNVEGNIDLPPAFTDEGNNLYNLSSNSPCIDAGPLNLTGTLCPECDLGGCVRVWDGNGDQAAVVDMGAWEYGSQTLGFEEARPTENIAFACRVFPNPAGDKVTLQFEIPFPGMAEIRLTLPDGRIQSRFFTKLSLEENKVVIDLSQFPTGIFCYEVLFNDHRRSGMIVHQ